MPARLREEVMICKIHTDQPDATCSHVHRQAQRDVRRVLCVMKNVRLREVGASVRAEAELDDIFPSQTEIIWTEEIKGLRAFDIVKAVAGKLIARINDDQVMRVESTADIIDADGDESLGFRQLIKRLSATAYNDGGTLMYVSEVCQRIHGIRSPKAPSGDRYCLFSRKPTCLHTNPESTTWQVRERECSLSIGSRSAR